MPSLTGKWNYQSFVAVPAGMDGLKSPQIAAPWTPPAVMEFSTDGTGAITGSAQLVTPAGSVDFKIAGKLLPAEGSLPEGIELKVTVEKVAASYSLRGYFVKDSDHIVGSVVALSNDLRGRPPGTSGPFILYPAK